MNLRLKQAKWNTNNPIHLELSDGQFIKAGTNQSFTGTHTFDAKKKINRVEVIIKKGETMILWITFTLVNKPSSKWEKMINGSYWKEKKWNHLKLITVSN